MLSLNGLLQYLLVCSCVVTRIRIFRLSLLACCCCCCLLLLLQLLVFCKIDAYGNPTVPGLLSLAGQMKMGRGLLMAVGLLEGDMVEVSLVFFRAFLAFDVLAIPSKVGIFYHVRQSELCRHGGTWG